MKKRIIALILSAAALTLSLAGCTRTCKADGCKEEVYKDGYCEAHYYLNELGALLG